MGGEKKEQLVATLIFHLFKSTAFVWPKIRPAVRSHGGRARKFYFCLPHLPEKATTDMGNALRFPLMVIKPVQLANENKLGESLKINQHTPKSKNLFVTQLAIQLMYVIRRPLMH